MEMTALKSGYFSVKSGVTPRIFLDCFLDLARHWALVAALVQNPLARLFFVSERYRLPLEISYPYPVICACPRRRHLHRPPRLNQNSLIHPVWHPSRCLVLRLWLETKRQGGRAD